ncbi:GntR family transcriptional regulator [Pollutimonas subterranea]|uniref:GntR family transcriptional regulator n=1 Tax=Pollutimonas subterranea TaxID=2045210 RepID=A0A2N4U3I8_9BURK|nr:amidohydrolase family protein [Pollutimonas subterranea]PLC49563.1 GntR family transcriptional regulator [Pollutimonas subterranea]
MPIPGDLNNPCLGPLLTIEPPRFEVPAGACDTHAHVISADTATYPLVATRSYTPAPAPEDAYLHMLEGCGMSRGVLVQVSVYGTDNRYMLEVLKRHPERLRGVAVVDPAVTDSELAQLHAAGVRGIRINVLFGGGIGFDAMETLAARIAPLGWHMQFLLDARQLPEIMPRISGLPCPIVIDHMGHMPAALGVDDPGFQALLHLVKNRDTWVKLSGAYRLSTDFDQYADVTQFAHALVDAAPDRLVWGSDWPHVAITQMPNTGRLLNQLEQWVPDAATRNRILVDNPQRLYQFV